MRLLHTSDWHLGQELYRHDRSYEHKEFLKWLKEVIVGNQIDVLLIAGDVYDSANPSAAAQRLFFNFVRELKQASQFVKIIATAGNHDSPARFEVPADLFETFSAHVVGRVTSTPDGLTSTEDFLVPLAPFGSSRPEAVCIALPYLRAADVYWPGEVISYPEAVLRAYGQAIVQAQTRFGKDMPLIALGHMHARGGQVSDESERKLVIGGEEAVSWGALANQFKYVALGHLHLAQRVGGFEHVRYSGSPLPLSFSELHYNHQVLMVELSSQRDVTVQPLSVPRRVELFRCPKEPQNIETVLAALSELKFPQVELDAQPYLEVPVHIEGPVPDLRSRIEKALENVPVRLGRIVVSRKNRLEGNNIQPALIGLEGLKKIDPLMVFESMHQREFGAPASAELRSLFTEVMRELSGGSAS